MLDVQDYSIHLPVTFRTLCKYDTFEINVIVHSNKKQIFDTSLRARGHL